MFFNKFSKSYYDKELHDARGGVFILSLSNGKKVKEQLYFDKDLIIDGITPGSNKPCYNIILDIGYLQTWAQRVHGGSITSLQLQELTSGSGTPMNLAQFTWALSFHEFDTVYFLIRRK